jgi:hypothetical protein
MLKLISATLWLGDQSLASASCPCIVVQLRMHAIQI